MTYDLYGIQPPEWDPRWLDFTLNFTGDLYLILEPKLNSHRILRAAKEKYK